MARNKKLFILKCLLACLLIVFFIFLIIFLDSRQGDVKISFLDIGQGDSTLINIKNRKFILIDGGPNNLALNRLGNKIPFYHRVIDLIIISHFHEDHITGLIEILKRYQVKKIIFGSNLEANELSDSLMRVAKERGSEVVALSGQGGLVVDKNCNFFFINPVSLGIKQNSNNSLVTKFDCNHKNFLFAGDNEADAEQALLSSNFDIKADIFKSSHHGSKTSNNINFLKAVNPKMMIISVGIDNKFGHPSPQTLDNANNLGITVLQTSNLGTIDILANLE